MDAGVGVSDFALGLLVRVRFKAGRGLQPVYEISLLTARFGVLAGVAAGPVIIRA